MRNKLAKCNKCGSNETHARPTGGTGAILQCFNCGTIQLGEFKLYRNIVVSEQIDVSKSIPYKFVPRKCPMCKKDITRIDKNLIPVWHTIRISLDESKYICDFCYELYKPEIFKREDELREAERKIQSEINKKEKREHIQKLNSMSKEELINRIIELENQCEDYDNEIHYEDTEDDRDHEIGEE